MSGRLRSGHGHAHPTGYQPGCDQCKADRKALMARKRASAELAEQRKTPERRATDAARKRQQRATDPFAHARVPRVLAFPGGKAKTPATAETSATAPAVGENETAVRAQCEMSTLADAQPGTVAQAITLARILDNPQYMPIHAQTSRQLHTLLSSLGKPKRKMSTHLSAVQTMVGRKAAQ